MNRFLFSVTTAKTTTTLAPGGSGPARIEVLDRGPGVPDGERDRLFSRFFRGRAAIAAGTRGSGLGLSLVAHAARAHGGHAGHEPRPGGGSVFYLEIPRSEEE